MLNLRTKIIPFTNQLASIKKAAFSSSSKLAGNYGPNGYNFELNDEQKEYQELAKKIFS